MRNLVKVERARFNLTQAQLAEKLNVSRQTIHALKKINLILQCIWLLKWRIFLM